MSNKIPSNGLDEEDEKIIRKLKKGNGKYKEKLPLKCSVVEKLGILLLNVLFQRNKIVMMKMNQFRKKTRKK